MDANESGIIVGGCVFPAEDDGTPARIIGCTWQAMPLSADAESPTLVFDGASLCPDAPWFGQSVFTAVGPIDSDGACVVAGVAAGTCEGGASLPVAVTLRDGTLGSLSVPAGVDLCEGLDGNGDPGTEGTIPVNYSGAVEWDPVKLVTQVLGSHATAEAGDTQGCGAAPAWEGYRWAAEDGVREPIRAPATCTELGSPSHPAVALPDGTPAFIRTVHISSIVTPRDSEDAAPLAGGALGMDMTEWGPCQSTECFRVHGAVFIFPFANEEDVVTFDVHQSIVDRPDQGAGTHISSWVTRVESTLSLDTDWMAVGARALWRYPTSTDCEGVVWTGMMGDPDQAWCGRSVDDDRVVQRRAFMDPPEHSHGRVTTEAVHDLLASGVAVGVGSVVPDPSLSNPQVILLTEACDINGDQMVDRRDLVLFLQHWKQHDNPCDLTGDGDVDDPDLRILLQAIGGNSVGRPALIEDICGDYWAKTPPLPYSDAVQFLGFQDFSEFGDHAASLDPDHALILSCSATIIAQAIAGQ